MHSQSTGLSSAATHTLRSYSRGSVRPVNFNVHSRLVSLALSSVEMPRQVSQIIKVPEVHIPAESARNFKHNFETQQADINWMRDSTGFEQRASKVLSATCDLEILQQLASFSTDPSAPSALLLTGLPVEDELPATHGDPPIAKVQCLATSASPRKLHHALSRHNTTIIGLLM